MIRLAKKSILVAALMASTSAIASSGWSVSEASGSVTITRGDKVIQARKDSRLNEGDVIRTGKGARAVLVRGKEYLVVSPKAHIRIAEPEKAGPVTQIFQYLGNVLFKIEKKSTPHFGVETPYMAAVVKGTTFNVSVGDDGTSVQVTEGAVEVTTGDDLEAALLTPGLVGLVEADAIGDLIVISNDPDGPGAEEATVRGSPSFVPALSQPAAEPATRIASAGGNSERGPRADNVSRDQPFARPIAAGPTTQTGPGRASTTAPGLQVAIGAASGGDSDSYEGANDDIIDSGSEAESSAVQDFVISEPGDGESGATEFVTQDNSSEAAPAAEETDTDIDLDLGAENGNGNSDGNNGNANGMGNDSGGGNGNGNNGNGNGNGGPNSDDDGSDDDVDLGMGAASSAGEGDDDSGDDGSEDDAADEDVSLDAGVGGPADDSDSEEVDVGADLGLGSDNDDSDDDGPGNGNGNGNSGGNNGNANGIGNGNGGGNGNGNNDNGNGNGGPSSDGDDVGLDAGIGGPDDDSDNEEVDLGADLGLGLGGNDDDDDDAGERGEGGEGGERGRGQGNNGDDDDDDDADEGGERGEGGEGGNGPGQGRGNND